MPNIAGVLNEEAAPPKPAYEGYVETVRWSGCAALILEPDGLRIETLFDQEAVAFADIEAVAGDSGSVRLRLKSGDIEISRMGESGAWFRRELLEAFDKKVRQVLLVDGAPAFETTGGYRFDGCEGTAKLQVFEDCLCLLPPNRDARRLPFLFVSGLKKEGFSLVLTMSGGERYLFSQLGYDLDPLENQIAAHIRAARERGTAFIKKLDDSLGFSGNAQAARLLPEGVAVPLKTLAAAHPSLAAAVERKIQNSKMGETVPELRRLCDGSRLAAGILSLPEEESEALRETLFSSAGADGDEMAELTPEQEDALRWIVFAALPSKDGRLAVVEFAFPNEEAATYLFRMEEPWEAFLTLLNRALEATGLRREILSLPEERLHDEANADTRMAVIRTPAVRSLRARFTGRVIHRGLDAWRSGLIKQLAPSALQGVEEYRPKFCGSCGAPLTTGARFCGICGAGQG